MPNYRKSFNFRNGVQVDEDNFVVNPVGLVGIGTTVPTELLDVLGNVKISGILSVGQLYVGQITNTSGGNFTEVIVGVTSISSGIITSSTVSGVVTYYGDGGKLINLPTSQWIDVDSGFGYTSIYAAGYVGVTTNYPYFPFQVGGSGILTSFSRGVGIGSEGNILATGIVTAGFFVGSGIGITNINANNIETGTLSTSRLPIIPNDLLSSNIDVTGIITARTRFSGNLSGNVNSTGVSTFSGGIQGNLTGNVNSTGVSTFSGGIQGNLTGNVNSTGVSTFSGGIQGNLTGNLTGNVNSTGISTFSGGIRGNLTGNVTGDLTGNVIGIVTGNLVGIASTARDLTSDARLNIDHIMSQTSEIGISTVSSRLRVSGQIGVNTNSPQSDIHILNNTDGRLQVTGEQSFITIGRSLNPTNNSGGLKFGNTVGLYPYSNIRSLDIVNYDTGNINNYLLYDNLLPFSGVGTGNFNWFYGLDRTNPLMTLTYEGNLGLGATNPIDKLQVSGNVNATSLSVDENIFAIGAASSVSTNKLYVYGGKSQILNFDGTEIFPESDENVNITSGISTLFNIKITNNAIFNGNVGVGTTNPQDLIQVGSATTFGEYVTISENGIGLGTSPSVNGFFLEAKSKEVLFGAVSIGNTGDVVDIPGNYLLYVDGTSRFNGNIGIKTENPESELSVNGDIRAGYGSTQGVILTSPDGSKYRLTVSNAGNLSTVLVT